MFAFNRLLWLKRLGLALALVVIVVDQVSKYLVLTRIHLEEGESLRVLSVFSIVHWWNKGVSFGFMNREHGEGAQFAILVILTFVIVCTLLFSLGRSTRALTIMSLGLIIGGALGNLIDRLHYGAVEDFLYFHWDTYGFPAFNVADSCVCVGVGLLLLDGFLARKADTSVSFSDT